MKKNKHMEMTWAKAMDVLKPTPAQLERGLELHRECTVCDSFGFMPKVWTPNFVKYMNGMIEEGVGQSVWSDRSTMHRIHGFTETEAGTEEFISALDNSGVSCMVQTVGGGENLLYNLQNMAAHQHLCRMTKQRVFQAGSSEEVLDAKKSNKTALIFSVNGPPPIGDMNDPDAILQALELWYQLGVRFMHLSYNRRNFIADGCTEPCNSGLSDFGYEFIAKMNDVGIVVDTPHSSRQATFDAARVSEKPITATHIGVRALMDHPRCKTDEELKAIADTGGMIGIYGLGGMLGPDATIATVLDHLDYAKKVIGSEHVSIGTDNCYQTPWPDEIKGYPAKRNLSDRKGAWKKEHKTYSSQEHIIGSLAWTNWPLFTVGMVMRGYRDDEISNILGKNLLRVLDANRPDYLINR